MRIQILSDIHLEFASMTPPHAEADLTIIAGDTHTGNKGMRWLRNFKNPVVCVLGNHEFYGYYIEDVRDQFKKQKRFTYLENNWVEIDDVKIFGCTLWTNFKLFGNDIESCIIAKRYLNDFNFIRDLSPEWTQQLHKESLSYLRRFLELPGKKVVVTHHAPSIKSVHPRWTSNLVTPAFASNLEHMIIDSDINLWIHGHTHDSCDYKLGNTRIICNPRGYPPGFNRKFNERLVAKI